MGWGSRQFHNNMGRENMVRELWMQNPHFSSDEILKLVPI